MRRLIAVPRIGVGYGGLSWKKVRVIIERVFHDWSGQLIVYEEFVPPGETVPHDRAEIASRSRSPKRLRKETARLKLRFRAITIACTDPARSVRFYETVLGAVRRPSDNGIGNSFRLGGIDIVLLPNATEISPGVFPTHAMPILWLEVDDLAAAQRSIAEHGVAVIDEGDGQFLMVADPDGLVIEIWECESRGRSRPNCPYRTHQVDIEPSEGTSIRLPLEESDRLARSTHCLVPSRQGEPFNLVTSSDHAHTTVVLRRSVSGRLESPRANPVLHCSGRRIYGCLNACSIAPAVEFMGV